MPLYTPGRRRAIVLLLLTSALLLTLDLRGAAIFDSARAGFRRALEPFETAADVVTKPIRNAWHGVMDYDDLAQENQELREQIDAQVSDQIAGRAFIQAYQDLLALNELPALSDYATVTAAVEGQSPGNLDQVIEINKGRNDNIEVGMAVISSAGLIGKVTAPVLPDRAYVMLITDPQYVVQVKIVAPPPPPEPPTTPAPPTTLPPPDPAATTLPPEDPAATTPAPSTTVPAPTTTIDPQRDTGRLSGQGGDALPQVDFLQDTPIFGRIVPGDIVLTAGGSTGLAPADIPVGLVENVIQRSTAEGPLLEVAPLADLDELRFVKVVLYKPSSEFEEPSPDTQAGG
jgi:rod shape-determining protein MreC